MKNVQVFASRNIVRLLAIICLALSFGIMSYAQDDTRSLQSEIEQVLSEVQSKPDSAAKAAQEKDLRAAQQLLSNATLSEGQLQAFKLAAETEEAALLELAKATLALRQASPLVLPDNRDAQAQSLTEYESLLLEKRNTLDELNAQKTVQANRTNAIAKDLPRLQALRDEEQSKPKPAERLKALTSMALLTDLRQRIATQQTELATLPARQRLLEARTTLANLEFDRVKNYVERLKLAVGEDRVNVSQSIVTQAQAQLTLAQSSHPQLVPIAAESLRLAEKLLSVTQDTAALGELSSRMNTLRQRISVSSSTVERVLAADTLTDETANLLRRVQSGLPDVLGLQASLTDSERKQTDLQLRTILWEESLGVIGRSDTPGTDFLATQFSGATAAVRNAQQNPEFVNALQIQRRDILVKLIDAARIDSERRTSSDIAIRETVQLTSSLKTRLERRLLWLRTSDTSPLQVVKNLPVGFGYLFSPDNWRAAIKKMGVRISQSPERVIPLILLPLLLWISRPRIKANMSTLAARVGSRHQGKHSDAYWVTPKAIFLSALIALPLSLVLLSAGFLLSKADGPPDFSQALGLGLTTAGTVYFVLHSFKTMCRDGGVLGSHLGWSDEARHLLFRHLRWLIPIMCLTLPVMMIALFEGLPNLRYGVGLLSFVVLSMALAITSYGIFRPNGGVVASINMRTPPPPFIAFMYPLLVLIPAAIGLAPLFGYFDTAFEVQQRVYRSGVLGLIISILYGLLVRIFSIAHDRDLVKQRAKRMANAKIETQRKAEADQSGDAIPAPIDLDEDMRRTAQIGKTLLTLSILAFIVGLWKIWGPLLPALGIAEDIVLWNQLINVDGELIAKPTTLSNLFFAALLLFGAVFASRNAKEILELFVFDRLQTNAGSRYAAVTIAGYVLTGLGIVISLAMIGLDWSKLQWVIAALGVGIGFGLQEIIANFISGIIILFERPVRVGDIVTINNLSGTVQNIKIRATTITDFDNREVLLPNKSIITGEVTNWTLTDNVTRLVIKIGVAYGSDIEKVRQVIMKVIAAHPDVLSEPAPTIFFLAHGDSSLDFEVRIFVAAIFQRLPTTHDINAAINTALTQNNIEIPFPQRDIHVKNAKD